MKKLLILFLLIIFGIGIGIVQKYQNYAIKAEKRSKLFLELLVPGEHISTPDVDITYPNPMVDVNNWVLSGSARWETLSNGVPRARLLDSKSSRGYMIYKNIFDMKEPFELKNIVFGTSAKDIVSSNDSGKNFAANYNSNSNNVPGGDSLGFVLTPGDVTKGNAGVGLGISGLPNSIFIGRDFYMNSKSDADKIKGGADVLFGGADSGTHLSGGDNVSGSDQISIRETDSSGILIGVGKGDSGKNYPIKNSNIYQPWLSSDMISVYPVSAVGVNTYDKNNDQDSGDIGMITWHPKKVNDNETVEGTLTLTMKGKKVDYRNLSSKVGAHYPESETISGIYTLPAKMNVGLVASSGTFYSQMYSSLGRLQTSFSGQTDKIKVNYIGVSTTGNIIAAASTEIQGLVGKKIRILGPEASPTSEEEWNYRVPNISEYNCVGIGKYDAGLDSSQSVTVVDTQAGVENIPEVNVYYETNRVEANFKSYYTLGTPGTGEVTDIVTGLKGGGVDSMISFTQGIAPVLASPNPSKVVGRIGENIDKDITINVPMGYRIDYVVAPDGVDGKRYPTLDSAISSNPSFESPTLNRWANYFIVYICPNDSRANFTYKYVEGVPSTSPALPSTISQTGVVGGLISKPKDILAQLPSGAQIQSVIAPDGVTYESLEAALNANKYYLVGEVTFTFNITIPESALVYPKVVDKHLYIYFSNVSSFSVWIDGEYYQEFVVKKTPIMEREFLNIPIDTIRNKISIRYNNLEGRGEEVYWNNTWDFVKE